LYQLALKYLIIPASSAAAERQFSKAKRIQGERRQSLSTKTFQALVYVAENQKLLADDSFRAAPPQQPVDDTPPLPPEDEMND
jgi:Tfp pilus assembly protein PilF